MLFIKKTIQDSQLLLKILPNNIGTQSNDPNSPKNIGT